MLIHSCSNIAIDECNMLMKESAKLFYPRMLFLVYDHLMFLPLWANWIVVQPSGSVMACELPQQETEQGWLTLGETETWGIVDSAQDWQTSLEVVDPTVITTAYGLQFKHHCIRNYRRLVPDTTIAVTMDASGLVQAWPEVPAIADGKWLASDECSPCIIGDHGNPKSYN